MTLRYKYSQWALLKFFKFFTPKRLMACQLHAMNVSSLWVQPVGFPPIRKGRSLRDTRLIPIRCSSHSAWLRVVPEATLFVRKVGIPADGHLPITYCWHIQSLHGNVAFLAVHLTLKGLSYWRQHFSKRVCGGNQVVSLGPAHRNPGKQVTLPGEASQVFPL